MIVLADIEKQLLVLYTKDGMINIPFSQATSIYEHIEGNNVLYITGATEVNAGDIVNMIKNMGIKVEDPDVQDSGVQYIHGISDGTIYIDETLKFEGKFDCKVIDEQMKYAIQNSHILQGLLKNKKIEIIGEMKRRKLMKDFKTFQEKQLEKQELIDKSLDNMILKDRVADWDGTVSDASDHDAVVIDIGGAGKVGSGGGLGPVFNTMSELMDSIDGI